MIICPLSMTKVKVQVGSTELFLYEIGGHLTIRSTNEDELLRYRKGSVSFRTKKRMKVKNAIKDIIKKSKGTSTEILLIDCSG